MLPILQADADQRGRVDAALLRDSVRVEQREIDDQVSRDIDLPGDPIGNAKMLGIADEIGARAQQEFVEGGQKRVLLSGEGLGQVAAGQAVVIHGGDLHGHLHGLLAGPAGHRVVAGVAQAAHGAYANAEEAYQAFRQGNNPEAARYVTESGLNGLRAGFAGYHAARGHAAPNVPRGTSEPIAAPAAPAAEGDFTGSRSLIPRAEPTAAAPPMGAPEPESGRPVLQQSPRPEVNQAAATAEHPAVRQTIEQTLKPVQGATLAGARPEKEADRTQEKIEKEGQTPRTVRDYSGFRIAVDSPAAADAAAAALGHAFEVVNRQDEFVGGDPETGFHGLT